MKKKLYAKQIARIFTIFIATAFFVVAPTTVAGIRIAIIPTQ